MKAIFTIVLIVTLSAGGFFYFRKFTYENEMKNKEEKLIGITLGYNIYVKEIQETLKQSGFDPGPVDGVLADKTRLAIKDFQQSFGLEATGRVDTKTYLQIQKRRLNPETFIRQVQTALKNAGFYKGRVDGEMGPKTEEAIKKFQESKGLTPDGIIGDVTFAELKQYMNSKK